MTAYVCYGRLTACVVAGGFSCTRDELPAELARVALPKIGVLLRVETYGTAETAREVAAAYSASPAVLNAAGHR